MLCDKSEYKCKDLNVKKHQNKQNKTDLKKQIE